MIALSAGHYPKAPGACWPPESQTWCEHDLAMRWVARVAQIVHEQVMVHVIPSGWLGDKVRAVNTLPGCKLAVEIHFNSASSAKARGSETLYCPGSAKGYTAARTVQDHLSKIFLPDRGAKEGWHRMDRPGHVDYAGDVEGDEKIDYFLAKTKPVSLIVEPEFIFNVKTLQDLELSGCRALANGLLAAYEQL